MDKISIIVPVYNAGNYLERCLESLIYQSYEHLEIILVNDGSTDNSLEICKVYANKDSRIHVIDKMNEGVAVARNTGLERATGKYIGFVDADDWIELGMYEALYRAIRNTTYPICICNYYKDDKRSSSAKKLRVKESILSRSEVAEKIITNMVGADDIMPHYEYIMGAVWRCLYEKAFLDQNGIRFEAGITIMEDLVFNVQALLKSEGIVIEPGIWYHYVQNPKSALHSYNETMWEDQIKVHDLLEKALREAQLDKSMRNRLDMRYIGMAFSAIYNEINRAEDLALTNRLKRASGILKDEKFKVSFKRARPLRGSRKRMKLGVTSKRRIKI